MMEVFRSPHGSIDSRGKLGVRLFNYVPWRIDLTDLNWLLTSFTSVLDNFHCLLSNHRPKIAWGLILEQGSANCGPQTCFVNKVCCNSHIQSRPRCLWLIPCTSRAEQLCLRPRSIKYLQMGGPLQKKCADPWWRCRAWYVLDTAAKQAPSTAAGASPHLHVSLGDKHVL